MKNLETIPKRFHQIDAGPTLIFKINIIECTNQLNNNNTSLTLKSRDIKIL